MRIGVPAETKADEYRVAATPAGVKAMVGRGHEVFLQAGAGEGAFFTDDEYAAAGAVVEPEASRVWEQADLIYKVKEPTPAEHGYLRDDLSLFAYLHMAADLELTEALLAASTTAVAYESVSDGETLPLLAPMSEIAGRLATQVGADVLLKHNGGRGVLLGGIPGTRKSNVVVIGGGVVGTQAAQLALGLGADVTIIDLSLPRLRQLDAQFKGRVHTLVSTPEAVAEQLRTADLVIGAVLIPGARTPTVVTTEMIMDMQPGSVLVDVAVDQGGCFEPTRPTTHADPTFRVGPALMYCVANMPGAVPRTATVGLANATLPYALKIAELGVREAARRDPRLAAGLSTIDGKLTLKGVADAWNLPLTPIAEALG